MPRRNREHSEHMVLPSGITRVTIEYVSCVSMWKGTPSDVRYAGSTSGGKPGCFWSRLTATMSNGNGARLRRLSRSEEHTSELQSLMRTSYAVFCLKKTTHT